jgi:hypothetical protein
MILALLLLPACDPATDTSGDAPDVSLAVNPAVGSVLDLTVRTDRPSTLSVRFGVGETRDHRITVDTAATEHQLHLYGLPYGYDAGVTVEATDDAGVVGTRTETISTDGLPSDLPAFSTGGAVASWQGGYAVLNTAGSANYALIIDSEGRVCWAWRVDLDPDDALMRARLGGDGETMYLVVAGRTRERGEGSHVLKLPLHGGTVEKLEWPWLDHDLVELEDGTLAGITRVPEGDIWGDAVVERDPTGAFTTVYSTWDDPALGEPKANNAENTWTHMESLDWDPDAGLYTFMTYLTDHFVRLRRSDGEPVLHLYGEGTDYQPADGQEPLHVSHQFEVLSPTRFVHFENGGRERAASRAVEFELDEASGTYREVWSYTADPPLYVYIKGDVDRFDDGATEILWATAGRIEDVSTSGTVDWWLQLDLGAVFTYVQHVDQLGSH